MGRFIHTFQCGEVGIAGTRRVIEGGRITVGGSRGAKHDTVQRVYQDPLLALYVGQIVYFVVDADMQNRITIYEVAFEAGKPGTRGAGRNRSVTGKFICMARPMTNEPGRGTAVKLTADTITDEQIRDLRDGPLAKQAITFNNRETTIGDVARQALQFYVPDRRLARRAARARCAEILNARNGGQS